MNLSSPALRAWLHEWSGCGPFTVGPDSGYGGTYRIYRERQRGNARFVARSRGQAVAVCAALNWYEAFDEAKHSESTSEERERPELREGGGSVV